MNDKTKTVAAEVGGVSKEMLEAEFLRYAKRWDVDDELEEMTDEDKDSFISQKRKITRAIGQGRASVSNDGATITLQLFEPVGSVTEVSFRVPRGLSFMAMDKKRENMGKLNSFMADASGEAPAVFAKMDGIDYKFCQAVAVLFLA